MAILAKLADLGFSNSTVTSEKDGVSTARVRTSKGWVYHRFGDVAQVEAWAKYHTPEATE